MPEPTREEALKDHRYVDGHEAVIEAYQITEHTIFGDGLWPPWLRMQRGKNDMNCVFRVTEDPTSLYINMNGTEGQLGFNAWVLRGDGDVLSVMGEFEFRAAYTKVVPVPEKPTMAATDGQTDQEFYDSLPQETIDKMGLKNPKDKPAPAPVLEVVPMVDQKADKIVADDEVEVLRQQMTIAIECLTGGASKGAVKARQHLQIGLETAADGGLQWCDCSPGSCDESTKWGCRVKSPLL